MILEWLVSPAPPDPVLIRWSTWLIPGFYCSEHLPELPTVVNSRKDNGVFLEKAKKSVNNTMLVPGLMQICQYRSLADVYNNWKGLIVQLSKQLVHNFAC